MIEGLGGGEGTKGGEVERIALIDVPMAIMMVMTMMATLKILRQL